MSLATPVTRDLLLGAYAARSCPVKTHNAFDPTVQRPPVAPTPDQTAPAQTALDQTAAGPSGGVDGAARFSMVVLDELITSCRGRVIDLRLLAAEPHAVQIEACERALGAGPEVVIGALLPPDPGGHRVGRPDLLVRGADTAAGRPGYHPVVVKGHKILQPLRQPPVEGEKPPGVWCSTLVDPAPGRATVLARHTLRFGYRDADFVQLAHYYRMLQVAGWAAEPPLAAVIGTDVVLAAPVLAWADLAQPAVRTFSRSDPEGWRLRSPLDRYDHEQAFRVDIATVAAQRSGDPDTDPAPLVRPVVNGECARCPWWAHCRPQLDPDDISLRIDKGALDRREITTLRRQGIGTVNELAGADLDALLPSYLPEVTHRAGAEGRLRVAVRRARMLLDGVDFSRETTGPVEVPTAEVEVDFDIESSSEGRIYLWGFLVGARRGPATYREFSRFDDLDDATELALALEAFGWLRGLAESSPATPGDPSVAVFHYSGYEVARIGELARREKHPLLDWAAAYASEHFVDLLEVVKTHYFGVNGLGLKLIARHAGFRWRDEDPGGLNSQRWFAEAVHSEDPVGRAQARTRVLEYNEDDVIATRHLRAWLRAQ